MRLNAKVGIATAIGALAMTGPAVAQACTNGQGNQVRDQQGAQSGSDHGFRSDHGQFARFGRRGRSFGRSEFGVSGQLDRDPDRDEHVQRFDHGVEAGLPGASRRLEVGLDYPADAADPT